MGIVGIKRSMYVHHCLYMYASVSMNMHMCVNIYNDVKVAFQEMVDHIMVKCTIPKYQEYSTKICKPLKC
jgi:hypothetical protein